MSVISALSRVTVFRNPSKHLPLVCARLAVRAFSSSVPTNVAGLLDLKPDQPIPDIQIDGHVRTIRAKKFFHFVTFGDGSSIGSIQAVVPVEQSEGLSIGAAVRLRGSWVPSQGAGQSHELQVTQATVLGPCDAKTYPIQNKFQTLEYLRTLPHLRPRIPINSAILRLRSEIIASVNRFFSDRQFIQAHTPILTSSDCEGAGEVFQVSTGVSRSLSPGETRTPFFRRPVYTTVSAQLHLEALAQALGNVWTLSPTFRAEQSDTPRHLSEFYMLEAEQSFADNLESIMNLVEGMLRHIASDLRLSRTTEQFRAKVGERWDGLLRQGWPRITYTEAVRLLRDSGENFSQEAVWGNDLHTEHEKYIARTVGESHSPVFVTNYPRDMKAFYMKESADASLEPSRGKTVECFDLLVPEFCEIAGGSLREHRHGNLIETMKSRGLWNPKPSERKDSINVAPPAENNLEWYVDLRRWGCPPHGGFGLGFDRLVAYLSGVQTVHDTSAFPRWYGRCDC